MNKRLYLLFYTCGGYIYSQPKTKTGYKDLLYLSKNYTEQARGNAIVVYLYEELRKENYSYFITAPPQCPDNKYELVENRFNLLYGNIC
jgi:hypothetical protein